jgi:N-acylneuraminate cytidylyltransferase
LGCIFARGGSKGVPRKNLRLLGGKPLIAHAIAAARAARGVDRVIVSTDDEEIAAAARDHGAEVPFMRPAELAHDRAPEWLAWQHAIRTMGELEPDWTFDAFVSVPTTSPMRSSEDIEACLAVLRDGDADAVITVTPAARNPYFNMVKLDPDGRVSIVIDAAERAAGRQAAPEVFDITTVAYAARPEFVLTARGIFDGRVRAVVVPQERSLDIDTPYDFRIAELLWGDRA